MLRIGIRHRPKDSDLSVPMVVGVEMVLCGGLLNWVCFEWLRHSYGVDTFSDYLPAMIIASTLIFGGIVVLCWVILQNK